MTYDEMRTALAFHRGEERVEVASRHASVAQELIMRVERIEARLALSPVLDYTKPRRLRICASCMEPLGDDPGEAWRVGTRWYHGRCVPVMGEVPAGARELLAFLRSVHPKRIHLAGDQAAEIGEWLRERGFAESPLPGWYYSKPGMGGEL